MTQSEKFISVVSPVYRSEKIVDELVKRLSESLSKITENYEIILVEDGGGDSSWKKIEENCYRDKRVKGIKLSRNFGQHYAITSGLSMASGNIIVIMDCDLQDDPDEIPHLFARLETNSGKAMMLYLREGLEGSIHFLK